MDASICTTLHDHATRRGRVRRQEFIRAAAARGIPFFLYFNHSLMHMPVIPRAEFKGQTGQGDWADSLLELDTDFGTLLDELDLAGDTVVVFAGDNGPEDVLLWRGTPGYWEGSYFLITDPQEREPLNLPYLHSWTVTHFNRLLAGYQASVKREPPIPAGAPLDYEPGGRGGPEDVEGAGPAPTRG